jgi:hypothetical protein
MQPSYLVVPAEGCWAVAGNVAGSVVVFITRIKADPRTATTTPATTFP